MKGKVRIAVIVFFARGLMQTANAQMQFKCELDVDTREMALERGHVILSPVCRAIETICLSGLFVPEPFCLKKIYTTDTMNDKI